MRADNVPGCGTDSAPVVEVPGQQPTVPPDSATGSQRCVRHAAEGSSVPAEPSTPPSPSCARCGASLPRTKTGAVKRTTRFCSNDCRLRELRDRRAAARAELAKALHEIRIQLGKAEAALATLGLLPAEQRHEGSRGR